MNMEVITTSLGNGCVSHPSRLWLIILFLMLMLSFIMWRWRAKCRDYDELYNRINKKFIEGLKNGK